MFQDQDNKGIYYSLQDLEKIRNCMQTELERTMKVLAQEKNEHPPLYYLSYLFRNRCKHRFAGYLGVIHTSQMRSDNTVYCDARVGSKEYDNTSNGNLKSNVDKENQNEYHQMPSQIETDAYRFSLWRLTDFSYREALKQYYARKSNELEYMNLYPELGSKKLFINKNRKNISYSNYKQPTYIDKDYWCYLIRKASTLIKKYRNIKDSWFEFYSEQTQSLFIDSQGQDILRQHQVFELRLHFWFLQNNGEACSYDFGLIEGNIENLPSEVDFLRIVKERIDFVFALSRAPRLNSFSGPILLDAIPSGVFFHEVVGHRLEGSRLLSPEDGGTFINLRGKKITPEYIDIIDNPLLKRYGKRELIGHFEYDDEGSRSEKVVLVKRGVLKNFLTSSSPIPKQKKFNGHARNQDIQRPISRMGNLIIQNHKPYTADEMRNMFLEEIRKQKKSFGIYIKEVIGGETGTDAYDFQAFKGEILSAVKVFPNGKEELIKGVDFVGTPLSALDSVICMGKDMEVSNSYCGAESGIIPVSTIAPSMLLSTLELQSTERERYTQYALDVPY